MPLHVPAPQRMSDVADGLAQIVGWARDERSPIGYFAALYNQTTAAIDAAIRAGDFADGERVEHLAVTFAGRYFAALGAWEPGSGHASAAWSVAFEQSTRPLLVIEHVLLGMNAHILLDLGVAAATVCPGDELAGLKPDFDRVNAVLGSLVDPMRRAVGRVERWMTPFNRFAHLEDAVAGLGVRTARVLAWDVATTVAAAPTDDARRAAIDRVDADVARLSAELVDPGGVRGLVRRVLRRFDDTNVADGIDALLGRS